MADVITRFKLETTQYDSKLRDAAKGLSDYTKQAALAGSEFGKFTQKNVEVARSFGTIATSATNSKDKVKELVGAYNDVAKAYNALTKDQQSSDFGKAMSQGLEQLQARIKETKDELYGLSDAAKGKGGGLFGEGGLTGMLQVAGGNLLSNGISALAGELKDAWTQSIELAKAGEGVRLAFERLNQPRLLANLKEATHGTVSELELMKAAVKFDDFKLPVEQLGTLLAFAQKKAKDTGQSVDYMVDSIVTGLGRKSLMILDNLGLSAAQIKERMKESGDMTKAVADIIREEMGKAGDYVETAADRAARAAADTTNQMEELGREATPLAEEWAAAWAEIKRGGMELLVKVLGPLADSARSIRKILSGDIGLKLKPEYEEEYKYVSKPGTDHTVKAPGGYIEIKDKYTGEVLGGRHFDDLQNTNVINEWKKSLIKTPKRQTRNKQKTEEQLKNEEIQKLTQEYIKASEDRRKAIRSEIKGLQDQLAVIQRLKDEALGKYKPVDLKGASPGQGVALGGVDMPKFRDQVVEVLPPVQQLEAELERLAEKQAQAWSPEVFADYQRKIDETKEKLNVFKGIKKDSDNSAKSFHAAASAIGSVGNALNSIEDPTAKIMGIIAEAIAGVAAGAGQAISAKDTTSSGWAWIGAAAAITASMVAMIAEIHAATGYAKGGVIPGNSFSGDNQWARVNSGETILNRAQAGVIASALQDSGRDSGYSSEPYVTGETIMLGANNHLKRSGQGELVTTSMLKRMGLL